MKEERRSGRTTRIIDAEIQEFFKTGHVVLLDHYWDGKGKMSPPQRVKHILQKFLGRLEFEHGIDRRFLFIDENSGSVKLKPK